MSTTDVLERTPQRSIPEPKGPEWSRVLPARVVARITDLALVAVAAFVAIVALTLLQYAGILFGKTYLREWGQDFRMPAAIVAGVAFHLWNGIWRVTKAGASLGKSQLGLRIYAPGEHPTLAAAAIRELLALLVVPPLLALTNANRRGGHDLAAGTHCFSRDASTPPGVLRDVRVYQVVGQIAAVVGIALLLRWLFGNLFDNLDQQDIGTDFDFLDAPAQFTPAFDRGFDDRSSVRNLVWAGVRNTALSASVGILIALTLGTLIGIARLSTNWLLSKIATVYVEIFRNIPPLVIIIFFGFAVFTFGPFPPLDARDDTPPPWEYGVPGSDSNWLILSNSQIGIPSFATDGNVGPFWIGLIVAAIVAGFVWRWRTRTNISTGVPHRRVLWSVGIFAALAVVWFLILGGPYRWSFPSIAESGRRLENGFAANAGYISVTVALGMYTASHIAEIVRGSILAVPKGQTEASNALALTGFQRYRHVILPQASRIAIPPTINQFLNLTKNTSLGIAVAYAEITLLTKSSIGNGRPAVQSLLVLMTVYLSFSIFISLVLNQVNKRVQLEGR